MNILFVCRANVGRSQMAAALYNDLLPGMADSAGTIVDTPGLLVKDKLEKAANVIFVMNELGINISENVRTQITEEALDNYDKVIVMAEKNTIPDYLISNPKVEYWDIIDPSGMDLTNTRKTRNLLIIKINQLIDKSATSPHVEVV